MDKIIIGITMGDPAGIGAEIVVKAIQNNAFEENVRLVVYGDYYPMLDALRICHSSLTLNVIKSPEDAVLDKKCINLIDFGKIGENGWEYKTTGKKYGLASYCYIENAIQDAVDKKISGIVTGPINKESLFEAGVKYPGHTEILAAKTHTKDFAMMLTTPKLCVSHVSTHVSLRHATDLVTKERVFHVISLTDHAMKLLGHPNPRIAVAGLNPHASEHGLFGNEEETEIIPAINMARSAGYCVDGPIPPDTVFVKAVAGQYDAVVAMYHDQGHIAVKLTGFALDLKTNTYSSMSGVNITIGLPIIRTSVDHGTAFGKAGEGRANEQSMTEAILCAIKMAKNSQKQ